MVAEWSFLRSTTQPGEVCEHWVARWRLQADSYKIEVSNLVHIWSEALERKAIFKRALNDNTTIDPTEEPTQLRLLLESAFKPLNNEVGKTEIVRKNSDILQLESICPLPAPLNSLMWKFHLTLRSENAVKSEIIAPLWLTAYTAQQQMDDLSRQLCEKDHVIDKLLDGLRSANIDIASIFPSATGVKALQTHATGRQQAGTLVPGFAQFDHGEWLRRFDVNNFEMNTSHKPALPMTRASLKIFKLMQGETDEHEKSHKPKVVRKSEPSTGIINSGSPEVGSSATNFAMSDSERTESEEEFTPKRDQPILSGFKSQVQRERVPLSSPAPSCDAQTDVTNVSPVERGKRAGKLGSIGTRRDKASPAIAESSCPSVTEIAASQPSAHAIHPSRPVKRLGTIGKHKQLQPARKAISKRQDGGQVIETEISTEQGDSTASAPTKNNQLDERHTEITDGSKEDKEATADRRRQDLKRSMEMRQQAPPKKKKRF